MIFQNIGIVLYLVAATAPVLMILLSKNVPSNVKPEWALYCLASIPIALSLPYMVLMILTGHLVLNILTILVSIVLVTASPWVIFYLFKKRYLEESILVNSPNRTIFVKTDYPKTRFMNFVCAVLWFELFSVSFTRKDEAYFDHAYLLMSTRIEYVILFATFLFSAFSLSTRSTPKIRTAALLANLAAVAAWLLYNGLHLLHSSHELAMIVRVGLVVILLIPALINYRALRSFNT